MSTSGVSNPFDRIRHGLDSWLVEDTSSGRFMLDRAIFTDPELFDLEMKHIFERNWVFLAHESQLANESAFLTLTIGRQPVLLTRNRSGELKCFINACTHRGARLCREKRGRRATFTCPFHGWTFSNDGALLNVTDEENGAYPEHFDRSDLGLREVGRLESYKGFVFASLSEDVPPLSDYLAGTKTFIDLMVDQSPEGKLEIIRGVGRYTYRGNWKMQTENGLDGYHVPTVHSNYLLTVANRMTGGSTNTTKSANVSAWMKTDQGGFFSFDHGHALIWNASASSASRPNFEFVDQYKRKFGEERSRWMTETTRNLLLFPNVFLMDQVSTQVRIVRPISVDETEITTYCIAPVGESARARAMRIRQYEDFFNASGMATPDDLTEFNNCQIAYGRDGGRYNDLSRGATRSVQGSGKFGKGLNIDATMSSINVADEGLFVTMHKEWIERMKHAIAQERAEASLTRENDRSRAAE